MKTIRIFLLLIIFLLTAWTPADQTPGKSDIKEANKIWGNDIKFTQLQIPAGEYDDTGSAREFDKVFSIETGSGVSGFIMLTRAMGRFEYFDYSIFFSDEAEVLKVMVTRYRSSRGAAICSKAWLSQFEGYKGKPMKVGEEIQAISGATISANSITRDIERCQRLVLKLGELKDM